MHLVEQASQRLLHIPSEFSNMQQECCRTAALYKRCQNASSWVHLSRQQALSVGFNACQTGPDLFKP